MPKHIARLTFLLVAFAILAYAAKVFFTVDSFYRYGHYRGDSVAEIASDKPKFLGSAYCEPCHAEPYEQWSTGVHYQIDALKVVQCEVCHGAAGRRDVKGPFDNVSTGVDHPESGKLAIPTDTIRLCSLCHEKMAGRPLEQKQIDVATHAGTQQCTTCHNPHSPKQIRGLAGPATVAAGGPAGKAARCAGCHGAEGTSTNPAWPNLAAQQEAYLVEATKAYQSGERTNAMMAAAAKALSDADINELAKHYAGLKAQPPAAGAAGAGEDAAGKRLADDCAGCHGDKGISSDPAWPNLAGQQREYLITALKAYRDGNRKNEMMAGLAKGLTDADIAALAGYYSRLRGE